MADGVSVMRDNNGGGLYFACRLKRRWLPWPASWRAASRFSVPHCSHSPCSGERSRVNSWSASSLSYLISFPSKGLLTVPLVVVVPTKKYRSFECMLLRIYIYLKPTPKSLRHSFFLPAAPYILKGQTGRHIHIWWGNSWVLLFLIATSLDDWLRCT